jgi:hypothetical protein
MKRLRIYVGIVPGRREVFRSEFTPTWETHGKLYRAVIGPFRTLRGAEYMRLHGAHNPHCQTVADAERLARD